MTDNDFRKEVKGYYDMLSMYIVLTILSSIFLVWLPAYFGNLVFPSIIAFVLAAVWVCIVREIRVKCTNDWYTLLEYTFCENKYSILEPGRKYILHGFDVEAHLAHYGDGIYGVTLMGKDGIIHHDIHPYYQNRLATILLKNQLILDIS